MARTRCIEGFVKRRKDGKDFEFTNELNNLLDRKAESGDMFWMIGAKEDGSDDAFDNEEKEERDK